MKIRNKTAKGFRISAQSESGSFNSLNLTAKPWRTYSCSPLCKFQSDDESLRKYSRTLTSILVYEKNRKVGVSAEVAKSVIQAEFKRAEGIASNKDAVAINLIITYDEDKITSEFYFCSVDADDVFYDLEVESFSKQFYVLPLVLCWCDPSQCHTSDTTFMWLQAEFDCCIQELTFGHIELTWMLTMWAVLHPNTDNRIETVLKYEIPTNEDIGIGLIVNELSWDTIKYIRDRIPTDKSGYITEEQVCQFIGSINLHLTRILKIRFNCLPLQEIYLQIAKVHSMGQIEITATENIYTILSYITSLAVEKINWKTLLNQLLQSSE